MLLMFATIPGYNLEIFTRPIGQAIMLFECIWLGLGALCLYITHKPWKRVLLFCIFPLPAIFLTIALPPVVTIISNEFGTAEEKAERFFSGESNILYGVDTRPPDPMKRAR
jgi:hypothetical protein